MRAAGNQDHLEKTNARHAGMSAFWGVM